MNNLAKRMCCQNEGWDDESRKFEKCTAIFKQPGCICHPKYCPDCSAEVHGIDITLPGVIERSSIENDCSAKGGY